MNQAIATYNDKVNRTAGIELNGQHMGVLIINEFAPNGFDTVNFYRIVLANIHNPSNPIEFKARTLKGLIGKINKHKFQLVK